MKELTVLALAAGIMLAQAGSVQAGDTWTGDGVGKGHFLIDLRVSDVIPDANSPIVTNTGGATGLNAQVGDSVMPTLGITYFISDHISVEAILGITQHTVSAVDATGARTKVYDTWVLPPVVTLQYRPFPRARISPYVGVGPNAMVYFSGTNFNGFTTRLRDEFGIAAQFGADVAIQGPWYVNFDAKKVWTNTLAKIDNGALYSHVGLNPWVASVGIGRKF